MLFDKGESKIDLIMVSTPFKIIFFSSCAFLSILFSIFFLFLTAYINLIFAFFFFLFFFSSVKSVLKVIDLQKKIRSETEIESMHDIIENPNMTSTEKVSKKNIPFETKEVVIDRTKTSSDVISTQAELVSEECYIAHSYCLTINTPFPVERHTEPFKGFEDVILTDAKYNEDIRQMKRQGKKLAFFDKHGVLIDVFPRNKSVSLYEDRQMAYSADYFVINGKTYDLNKPSDVASIEVPDFIFNGDVTSGIEYLMYMHRGHEDNPELEIEIVNKAFELMTNSKWQYGRQNYIALAVSLMRVDRFDLADTLYEQARQFFDDSVEIKYVNQDYNALKNIHIKRSLAKKEYALVKEQLPDLAPKSFSGYSRMKSTNTQNYQKILSLMKEKGFTF